MFDAVTDRFEKALPVWVSVLAVLALFLFAVRLLGTATDALQPVLERVLDRVLVGDVPALGAAWLFSYVLGNGSVVAAVSLSLFSADLVTPSQLFMMLVGSRLGAAGIVLLVGGLDYVQKGPLSLSDSLRLGMLTFVLTYTIFLPVTLLGYLTGPWFRPLFPVVGSGPVGVGSLTVFGRVAETVTDQFGAVVAFGLAFGMLLLSLRLFDRAFERVDRDWLRTAVFSHFDDRWVSFAAGVLVTAATTSIAFSLGIVVPLYNREYVTRSEMVPYVLGANIGTFTDTLLVAVVLQSPVAVATVGLLVGLTTLLTLLVLVYYDAYYGAVARVHERILASRTALALALGTLVVVPLVLVVVR
ncbi:sodium:phosphate symporter [Halobacteriales archaeon Cl-PHB]